MKKKTPDGGKDTCNSLLGDGTWNDEERVILTDLGTAAVVRSRRHLAHRGSLTRDEFEALRAALRNPTAADSRALIAARVRTLLVNGDESTTTLAASIEAGRVAGWNIELVDDKHAGNPFRRYLEIWKYTDI
ncbi:MAG: hypothetical protein HZA93_15870 [Verrucomicrobia bacterium]|nr:hypothetical protein [Verrucomicrobiota bacterium]